MCAEPCIAFLARDLVWADESGGVLPFSYAARKLDASLRSAPDLADVESTVIDLCTDDPEAFFERIREFRPTLIAASTFGRTEVAVGIQSFDTAVLQALGRRFDIPRFERVMAELQGRLDIDLELILGLPGDNPRSFRRTLERAMELGTTVRVFHCLALPDALLDRADELGIELDPETFMVTRCEGWTLEELQTEWAYVLELAQSCHRPHIGPNWVDFRPNAPPNTPADATPKRPLAELSSASRASLGEVIDGSGTSWRLQTARVNGSALLLDLSRGRGSLILEVTPAQDGQRCFRELGGLAYSYRGDLASGDGEQLAALILHIHAAVKGLLGAFLPFDDALL